MKGGAFLLLIRVYLLFYYEGGKRQNIFFGEYERNFFDYLPKWFLEQKILQFWLLSNILATLPTISDMILPNDIFTPGASILQNMCLKD